MTGKHITDILTRRAALVIGLASFVLYASTLSWTFAPGASSMYLARHLGADPFPMFADPLWGWCMRALAALSGDTPWVLNLFSAACVATATGLLTGSLLRIKPRKIFSAPEDATGQTLAAIAGGLYFAISTPVWLIATRAHPLALDTLLTAGMLYAFTGYMSNQRPVWLYVSTFIFGLGLVEFSSMYIMAPFVASVALLHLFCLNQLNARTIAILAICLMTGLLLYLPATLQHIHSPSLAWREIDGPASLFIEVLREQYVAVKYSLPKVGWLTTSILTVVPFFMALLYRLRSSYQTAIEPSRWLLIALMLAGLAATLINFPLAPWVLTKGNPLLVSPYLLAAMAVGLLLAHTQAVWEPHPRTKRIIAPLSIALTMIVLLAGLVCSFPVINRSGEAAISKVAEATLRGLQGQTWLITNGELDANLQLEARRSEIPLKLLNPALARSGPYRASYGSQLADARLAGLLSTAGLEAMLNEWSTRPEFVDQLAIMPSSEWWTARQFEPVISGLVHLGARPGAQPSWIEAEAENFLAFWWDFRPDYEALHEATRAPAHAWLPFIRRHLGRLANDLGVEAEEHELDTKADDLYRAALDIDPDNISARVNLFGMSDREAQREDLQKAMSQLPEGANVVAIQRAYGTIRTPGMYAGKALRAIRQGNRDEMTRTMDLLRKTSSDPMLTGLMLGQLHLAGQESALSAESYREVLASEPGNLTALLGLLQVSIAAGNSEQARSVLQDLRALNLPSNNIAMAEANIVAAEGDLSGAAAMIEALLEQNPDNPVIMLRLLELAAQQQDGDAYARWLNRLRELEEPGPRGRWIIANALVSANQPEEAREVLWPLLIRQPGNLPVLRLAMQINIMMNGDREERSALAKAIITLEPSHPMANYMMSALQYEAGRLDEAIASLRVSLAGLRNPVVMNNLAYALNEQGESEEAESLIREAIEIKSDLGSFWGTLAVIQLKQGKIDEAWASVTRARELDPPNPAFDIVSIKLYQYQGRQAEAKSLATTLLAEDSAATEKQREEVRALMR